MNQLTITFDKQEAERLRDSGIKTAVNHANAVSPVWSEMAYQKLREFIKQANGEFMTEEIRSWFAFHNYELPTHSRAFGGLIRRAASDGLIKKVGHSQVSNPRAHMAFAAVWIKA